MVVYCIVFSDQLVFYKDVCLIKCPNYRTFILAGPLTKFVASQNYCPSCALKCDVTKNLTTHQTIIKQISAGEDTADMVSYINETNSTSEEICDGFHKITFDISCKGCGDRARIFSKSIQIAREIGGCNNTGLCPYLCPMWQNVPIVQKIYEAYFGDSGNDTSTTAAGNSTDSTAVSASSSTDATTSDTGSSSASQTQSSTDAASSSSSGSPQSSTDGSSSSQGSQTSTVSSSSTNASTTDLAQILSGYSNVEICR